MEDHTTNPIPPSPNNSPEEQSPHPTPSEESHEYHCELSTVIKSMGGRGLACKSIADGWANIKVNGKILEVTRDLNDPEGWNPIRANEFQGKVGNNWSYTGEREQNCKFIVNGRLLPRYRLSKCMQR